MEALELRQAVSARDGVVEHARLSRGRAEWLSENAVRACQRAVDEQLRALQLIDAMPRLGSGAPRLTVHRGGRANGEDFAERRYEQLLEIACDALMRAADLAPDHEWQNVLVRFGLALPRPEPQARLEAVEAAAPSR